jgi:hypothetical protein
MMFLTQNGENSERKIAEGMPIAVAMTTAPATTHSVPTIVGNIPKSPLWGLHVKPNRKPGVKTLMPSLRRKAVMRKTITAEREAHRKSILLTTSPVLILFLPF